MWELIKEWIGKNKKLAKKIALWVLVIIPLIIYGLSTIPIFPVGGNNDWAGFWGGYLGAIISSLTTIAGVYLTLLDDRKKRKHEEIEKNREIKERRRLEILPYLKSAYSIPKEVSVYYQKETYFVDFTEKEIVVRDYLTRRIKNGIENATDKFYVLNYAVKNIGCGSAGNLLISVNGIKVVRNGAIASNDEIIIIFFWRVNDISDENLNIEFYFSDVANISHYYQNETIRVWIDNSNGYNDICMKKTKALTAPEEVIK